jgi:hypothetical protein
MKRTKILLLGAFGVLGGCSGNGLTSLNWRAPADVLTYTASTRVVPYPYATNHAPAVEATIVITNNTASSITFNYSRGICGGLELTAFVTPDFSGDPVWRQSSAGLECSAVGYAPSPLGPGQSVQIVAYADVSSVLAGGGRSGTYYFRAIVRVGGGDIRNSAVPVPAGSVQLTQ